VSPATIISFAANAIPGSTLTRFQNNASNVLKAFSAKRAIYLFGQILQQLCVCRAFWLITGQIQMALAQTPRAPLALRANTETQFPDFATAVKATA
jgi:hypothetical protein